MRVTLGKLFARTSSKVKPFSPPITTMYDKFLKDDKESQEENFRDFSGQKDGPNNESEENVDRKMESQKSEKASQFRDNTINDSAMVHLDDEAAHLMNLNPSHLRRTDQQLLEREQFIRSELAHDPSKSSRSSRVRKVVSRLDKDFRWGLGGQLMKRKKEPFNRFEMPTAEKLVKFLEKELLKDITVIDMVALERAQLSNVSIIATGYSNRHVYKAAKSMVKQLDLLDVEYSNRPMVFGRKDDEWVMVNVGKEFLVHFMTENLRSEVNLEGQWKNKEIRDLDDDYWQQYQQKHKEAENPFKFRNISDKK